MTKTILAIFENGILRPLQPLLGVANNTEVDVTVSTREGIKEPLQPGAPASVRACLGMISKADAEQMSRAVADEFEKVDDREW